MNMDVAFRAAALIIKLDSTDTAQGGRALDADVLQANNKMARVAEMKIITCRVVQWIC
jgi:hypothetical protein